MNGKQSFIKGELQEINEKLSTEVLHGIARNVKMGPFKATSGVTLPYYLNLSTNFMDKTLAPKIVELLAIAIAHLFRDQISQNEIRAMIGPEVAGGLLVSQFSSSFNQPFMKPIQNLDYIYMRKERKSSGTKQQLEATQEYTSRTPKSPLIKAIFIDDCLSTGTSMLDVIKTLKKDYNIEVVAALFLVDRSVDRQSLEKQPLEDPLLKDLKISAVYDLSQIDQLIKK